MSLRMVSEVGRERFVRAFGSRIAARDQRQLSPHKVSIGECIRASLLQSSFDGLEPKCRRLLTLVSKANGAFVPSKSCGSELPNAANTAAPVAKNAMDGANSASGHEPVESRIAPQVVTPTMPGTAPHVLVMPSSSDAWRGDRSAWLLYRPARENADRPWDADMSAATKAQAPSPHTCTRRAPTANSCATEAGRHE